MRRRCPLLHASCPCSLQVLSPTRPQHPADSHHTSASERNSLECNRTYIRLLLQVYIQSELVQEKHDMASSPGCMLEYNAPVSIISSLS